MQNTRAWQILDITQGLTCITQVLTVYTTASKKTLCEKGRFRDLRSSEKALSFAFPTSTLSLSEVRSSWQTGDIMVLWLAGVRELVCGLW